MSRCGLGAMVQSSLLGCHIMSEVTLDVPAMCARQDPDKSAQQHAHSVVQITSLECDLAHELVWAGTESGGVYLLQCPDLKRYSRVRYDLKLWL